MKKQCSILCAILLSLTLCACHKSTDAEVHKFETDDVQALVEGGVFSEELEPLDLEVIFSLYHLADYGLEEENLLAGSAVRSAGASCEEAAVLIFAEEKQAERAGSALTAYLQEQIQSNEDYRPQEVPKLEDAIVSVQGESVLLVVPANAEAVTAALYH